MPLSVVLSGLVSLAVSLALTQASPARGEAANTTGTSVETSVPTVEIITLGTGGGPVIRKDRSEISTVVRVGTSYYLIDCGIGTMRRLVEAGIDSGKIKAIFLTHLHPDHTLDLSAIMSNDVLLTERGGDRRKKSIYGPNGTTTLVAAASNYISVPVKVFADEGIVDLNGKSASQWVSAQFDAHDIAAGLNVFDDGQVKVSAAENTHYVLMPDQHRAEQKSISYRIDTPSGSIFFTGDTGPSAAVESLARGADLLVSEVVDEPAIAAAMTALAKQTGMSKAAASVAVAHMMEEHLSPANVAKLARTANVASVLLTHIAPGFDGDASLVAKNVAEIKQSFAGQVVAGKDLARSCLTKQPDGTRLLRPC